MKTLSGPYGTLLESEGVAVRDLLNPERRDLAAHAIAGVARSYRDAGAKVLALPAFGLRLLKGDVTDAEAQDLLRQLECAVPVECERVLSLGPPTGNCYADLGHSAGQRVDWQRWQLDQVHVAGLGAVRPQYETTPSLADVRAILSVHSEFYDNDAEPPVLCLYVDSALCLADGTPLSDARDAIRSEFGPDVRIGAACVARGLVPKISDVLEEDLDTIFPNAADVGGGDLDAYVGTVGVEGDALNDLVRSLADTRARVIGLCCGGTIANTELLSSVVREARRGVVAAK